MVSVAELLTFNVPMELSRSPMLKSEVVKSEPVPRMVRVAASVLFSPTSSQVALVMEPPESMIVVPPCKNTLPGMDSLAFKISVPTSDLLKLAAAPLMTPPRLAVAFAPTPIVEATGMETARLLVTPPLICNVPPLRVTAPELAPSAESLVMINELVSLMKTPPVKLLLVSKVREPMLDITSEVTPLMPPAPAMLYGRALFTTTGKAKNCAVRLILVGCGLAKSLNRESSSRTLSPAMTLPLVYCLKTVIPPATMLVQLAVARSQRLPPTPFQASWLGAAVTVTLMELPPAPGVAATPGGINTWIFARLGVPLPYLIRVNDGPTLNPFAMTLMTMLVPGAEMPPATLMARNAGLAVTEP